MKGNCFGNDDKDIDRHLERGQDSQLDAGDPDYYPLNEEFEKQIAGMIKVPKSELIIISTPPYMRQGYFYQLFRNRRT